MPFNEIYGDGGDNTIAGGASSDFIWGEAMVRAS